MAAGRGGRGDGGFDADAGGGSGGGSGGGGGGDDAAGLRNDTTNHTPHNADYRIHRVATTTAPTTIANSAKLTTDGTHDHCRGSAINSGTDTTDVVEGLRGLDRRKECARVRIVECRAEPGQDGKGDAHADEVWAAVR